MTDAIKEQTGIDFKKITDINECLKLAEEHNIELEEHEKTYGHIINAPDRNRTYAPGSGGQCSIH